MAIVIGKKQLLSTDLNYFKALQGSGGKTLFDRFKLAESNIINKNIDSKYQNFLAFPVVDGDAITFHGVKYDETPQVLQELEGDELFKYSNIKNDTISHYNSVIEQLKNSGKAVEADFLSDAIKYINDRFIYCYDDIVVLAIWGMTLRDNVRKDISEICKTQFVKVPKPVQITEPTFFTINYNAGENGNLNGSSSITKELNEFISNNDIPQVEPKEGFEFVGWDENPTEHEVTGNKQFTALYNPIAPVVVDSLTPITKIPWYLRFWNWLKELFTGNGCLKWLLWLLLILLILLLFSWLFKNCIGHNLKGGEALTDNDSIWVDTDPRVRDGGGIYDPRDPYNPVPTPPEYDDILPPQEGVLPPIDENPEIVPGNPSIIGNRINILMENEDKSIMDLAKDFKAKYPDDKYKVVYYDNVVKRMQVEIPSQEREKMKEEIPSKFSPNYKLFVFDEALLEGAYTPNDPALKDNDKNWYLQKIRAAEAWDLSQGSDKITVAIVDNGFNLSHPEFVGKVVQPYNVWTHSNDIFDQEVDHGTHVAGTALAIADNNQGLCGIAPNCKFMPVQVANKKGMMTTTSVLDGILYALYQGADVINVSLGGQFKGLSQAPISKQKDLINNHFKEEERLWLEIMRIAAKHNSTIVVAAGNDNILAGIDALQRPDQFITVSAIDKGNSSLNKANFSNYGTYSKLSAPGVGIYSTVGTNGYKMMEGTSMAAPIVTGAVALMKSINPNLTTKQIICILQNTALPVNDNIGKLIQIDKALQKVKSGDRLDCSPTPSTGDVQVLLNWNNYNDLDLLCTDPKGETVYYGNKSISSGGKLDIDMNVNYPGSITPIENIYWPTGKAPNGTYNVYLLNSKNHERYENSTSYKITVKYGGKTREFKGVINNVGERIPIFKFTLGNSTDNPNNNQRNSLLQQRKRLQEEMEIIDRKLKQVKNNN
jgi:subtilisin family serine protease